VSVATAALAAFSDVVGAAAVREATRHDAVQGVIPQLVIEPGDEDQVAATLREATRRQLAVVARGSGTKLEWGASPSRCDVILSTRRLDRLVEHQPDDLICVAQAGMRLASLQTALAQASGHQQRLMLDPPQGDAATLGGIVATAATGSLRSRYGTPRDLLIGVRFALADGTVGHAGGKVVKNVAGYDMGKLLTGSLGTLAVITELAFKLHPCAPVLRSIVFEDASASGLAGFVQRLRSLPVAPSVVDIAWPDGLVAVRVDSSEEGAERQAATIIAAAGGRVLTESEAIGLSARLAHRPWDRPGVIAAVTVPPTRLAELLQVCADFASEAIVRGLVPAGEARLPQDSGDVIAMRTAVELLGGHLALHRAPAAVAELAWPAREGAEVDLMRSLKQQLDPAGILSPGRHLAGV
jgi:glycolate oxidase FAD binding subunit